MIRTSRLAKLLAISFALTFAARAAATAEISVIPLGPITARGVPASFLLYLTDTNVTAPLCDRVAYDGTIGYGDGHQEAFTGGPSLALAPISRQFQHAYQYGSPAATVTLTATTDHYEPWDWIDLGPAGVIPIPGLCLTHTETEVQTFTETAPVLFLGQVSVDINGLADGSPGLAFSVYQGATACFQASVRGTLTDDPVSYSWSLQPGCDACRTLLPMIQGEPTPEQVAYEESVRAACAACGPQYGPVPGASFCRTFPDLGVWDVLAVAAPI